MRMKDDRLEEIAFTLKEVSDETEEIQLIFSDDKTVTVDKGAIVAYNTNGVVSINEQQVTLLSGVTFKKTSPSTYISLLFFENTRG